MTSRFILVSTLVIAMVYCSVPEVSFQDSFTLRVSVKRAVGSIEAEQNFNIYTHRKSIPWQKKLLHAKLVRSDVYDNTRAVDSFCKLVNPDVFQSPNDFCYKNDSATQVKDPLNPGKADNVFTLPAIYQSVVPLGTGESSQTIGLFDFQGVKEGVYDLVAFADTEVNVEVNTSTQTCTCMRAGGCSPSDFDIFLEKKATEQCTKLADVTGMIMPSNGDTFYVIDNVVVNSETEGRLKSLVLNLDSDTVLVNTKGGLGDQDVWDEWRCIYHIPLFTGYNDHLYTFPRYAVDQEYCLPGSTGCSSGAATGGSRKPCGTLMDYNTDYNNY